MYSTLMFATAAAFAVIAVRICKGNTDMIMQHHQTRVTDPAAYGRVFGRGMLVMAAAMFLSGCVGMIDRLAAAPWISLGILVVGLIIGIAMIVYAQKKYNNGIF